MTGIITTASELWYEISKTAQFRDNAYDKNLQQEIRKFLGLPSDDKMTVQIEKYGISCEQLMNAIMYCMEPFSQMLNDLYAMFRKASAQQSDHNLIIRLDFNRNASMLETDLDFFRQQVQSVEQCIAQTIARIPVDPFTLCREIQTICPGNYINDVEYFFEEDIKDWLQEYRKCQKGSWPAYVPDPPKTGYQIIDKQIAILWKILGHSIQKYRIMQEANVQPEEARFWDAERDHHWLGTYVKAICELAWNCKRRGPMVDAGMAKVIANKLEHMIEDCPMSCVTVEESIKSVIDIYNLPFWKKRYELYSAWISSQILKAFTQEAIIYAVKDNVLSFSFSGSHIATISSYNPPLDLWAEIRTHYSSPKGDSRRNHIQPDYTLAIGDVFDADRSVVVVECKQYKKYSRKNFLNAAEDYAGGRPNANVYLVNYGSIPPSLDNSVVAKFRKRVRFFESVRPSTQKSKEFAMNLKTAVDDYYNRYYRVRFPEYPLPTGRCTIRLRSDKLLKNTAMFIIATHSEQKHHIVYNQEDSNKRSLQEMSDSYRCYCSEETARSIDPITSDIYDIYVRRNPDSNENSGIVTVLIEIDGYSMYAISRTEPLGNGIFWHPYTIRSGKIIPTNDTILLSEMEYK